MIEIIYSTFSTKGKEEEVTLSLFRIPLVFFSLDKEDDAQEDDSQEDGSQEDDSQEDDSQEDDSQEDDSQEDDSQEDDSQEDDPQEDNSSSNSNNSHRNNSSDHKANDDTLEDSNDNSSNKSGDSDNTINNARNMKPQDKDVSDNPNDNAQNKNISGKSNNEIPDKNNAIDNARNMNPQEKSAGKNLADSSSKAAPNNDLVNAKNKFDTAKNAVKNAKDDPGGAAENLGTEATKLAARAIGDSVAPGVGKVAEKAVEVVDKVITSTETGKSLKKACCITSLGCSCLSSLSSIAFLLAPIFIPILIFASIWNALGLVDAEEKELNFIEVVEEALLNQPQKSLLTILDDALKEVKYEEEKLNKKLRKENNEPYTGANASAIILTLLKDNYSARDLKKPLGASKPEDFPGQKIKEIGITSTEENQIFVSNNLRPYHSMDSKHIPLFEDVLNNKTEDGKKKNDYDNSSVQKKIKENALKARLNFDEKVVSYIDETSELLDKNQDFYNVHAMMPDSASLRDLLEELSTDVGDGKYDYTNVTSIMLDNRNEDLATDFHELQERLAKLEVLTYMQAFRQYQMQISTLRDQAEKGNYILPDIYYEDDFFNQFGTLTDVSSYMSLALLCNEPAIAYEIACETIDIYKNEEGGMELKTVNFNGQTIGYIAMLKTWYANYTFDLVTTGDQATIYCTGSTSRGIDESSVTERSNLFTRYNINNKEQFFALYKEATGTDPVEGKDNIYAPVGIDNNWSYKVIFPVSASDATVSLGYKERYNPSTVEEYGLSSDIHNGIDFSVPEGTLAYAIHAGTVTRVENRNNGYGCYVEVKDEKGYRTVYAHGNGTFFVSKGDEVKAGQPLMETGNSGNSTGAHLHIDTKNPDGTYVDPTEYAES